jgi:hypothetical protein
VLFSDSQCRRGRLVGLLHLPQPEQRQRAANRGRQVAVRVAGRVRVGDRSVEMVNRGVELEIGPCRHGQGEVRPCGRSRNSRAGHQEGRVGRRARVDSSSRDRVRHREIGQRLRPERIVVGQLGDRLFERMGVDLGEGSGVRQLDAGAFQPGADQRPMVVEHFEQLDRRVERPQRVFVVEVPHPAQRRAEMELRRDVEAPVVHP